MLPDSTGNDRGDLSGEEITVRASSSYYEHLVTLNASFKEKGLAPIILKKADENLESEDPLQMLNATSEEHPWPTSWSKKSPRRAPLTALLSEALSAVYDSDMRKVLISRLYKLSTGFEPLEARLR